MPRVSMPTCCVALASGNAGNSGITLAEQWDGSAWQLQTVPSDDAAVNSVSCASPTFCAAVGSASAYTWDGSAWTAQTTPDPATSTFAHLNAISCASARSCEAGGYFEVQVTSNDQKALAQAWNRTGWQLQHAVAPRGATYNALSGISCVSAGFCAMPLSLLFLIVMA